MTASSQSSDGPIYHTTLRKLSDAELRQKLSGQPEDVARWVYAAATGGSSAAQVTLAQMLLDGRGLKRDRQAAFRWFGIAASAGDVDGINMLGRCYENGWGVAIDRAEAMKLFGRAAAKAHAWAQFNLGMMLLHDHGHPGDAATALTLFVRSARQGNAKAMNMIGRYREFGWACRIDRAAAMRWYRRAGGRGCFRGAAHLARFLREQGRLDEAVHWYRRSMSTAPIHFLRDLATHLFEQDGAVLHAAAREALKRAAEGDEASDLFAYGCALAHGRGGPPDLVEAAIVLQRAELKGLPGALGALDGSGRQ